MRNNLAKENLSNIINIISFNITTKDINTLYYLKSHTFRLIFTNKLGFVCLMSLTTTTNTTAMNLSSSVTYLEAFR